MKTHRDMANELHEMLTKSNLQIPISKVEAMKEILDWLTALKDGELVVSTKQ